MRVRGIDGWKKGWVAIDLVEGRFDRARVASSFRDLCSEDAIVIAVDMPVGLVDAPREADSAARSALGVRRSSVFPTPPRCAMNAASFSEALALARAVGCGLHQHAFALSRKIREVDAMAGDARIHEVHPELSFSVLSGAPLAYAKKTWRGHVERRKLLNSAGICVPDDIGDANVVPPDDVLDAAIAAWTAMRIARGEAHRYPPHPTQRDRDRVISIWA